MADEVIRRDVVQLEFDTNISELTKLNKEIDELKKSFKGGIGDDAFDDLKNNANESVKPLKKIKEQAEKVTKEVTNIGKKAAGVAFKGLKKLAGISFKALTVGITAAATALGALAKNAVTAYAEYEQLYGGMQTLLGAKGAKNVQEYAKITGKSVSEVQGEYKKLVESEKLVMKNANDAYKSAGMSANQYMTTITSFSAALTSSLGGDTAEAAKLADVAIRDMSDNANKMGTPLESISTVYSNLARGMYMTLDNLKLGYAGTKEGAMEMVNDAAKIDKSVKANDISYGNLVKAIHAVQVKMDIYGTTQKEADKTITGSLNSMKAAWGNLMPALIQGGDALEQCIDNFIDSAKTFGRNIMPAIKSSLSGIGRLIEEFAPILEAELPVIIDELLPPLISAATSLLKGLIVATPKILKTIIKEIPDIVKQIGTAIGEAFGMEMSALKKFSDFITKHGETIKKVTPYILGLVGAFMAFGKIKSVMSVFSGLFGKSKGGEGAPEKSGFLGTLSNLANMKTSSVLKGMANLGIILGGFVALTAILMVLAPQMAKLGGYTELLKLVAVIGVLGVVGGVLVKFGGIAGKIPVTTVALGLANMAIIIAGMSALFLLIGATSLINFDLKKITKIIGIIGLLGTVGTVLSVFAGIVGLVPIPIVLAGLANMGLVLGGVTALIVAFGALSEVKGFTNFLDKGGETLKKVFTIIGEIGGALVSGFGETVSKSLPTIGENIGKFGTKIKPLFSALKGVDMGGVGDFFNAIVSLLGMATGKGIIDGIKSFFGGGEGESPLVKLGAELTDFANKAKGFFTTIGAIPAESFPKAAELFKSLGEIKGIPKANKDGKTSIAAVANDLSTFNDKTSGFFAAVKTYDLDKVNKLWESLKNSDDVTKNLSKKVNDNISDIVKKVADLPKKMANAFEKSGKALGDSFVTVWKAAIEACVAPVNKLLDGANHVLKEFGSDKRVIEWKPYANGTSGHKGGNALVNDGRGAELVQMPNGRTFIPNGRNVFIPNAPKGMRVLPAEQTARLFGRNSPTFRYANGTGNIDVWSYYGNASGLVSEIAKGISYKGMSSFEQSLSKGMVTTFSGAMSAWVEKMFEEGVMGIGGYNPSKGVTQWRSTVARALKMEGLYSVGNVIRTLFQMRTESGGNPMAINRWDSNAKKGTPSKGLMQVIDPTFKAYARKGFDKNIYNPLSNILASVRYATARYGSLENAYRGHGYKNGVGAKSIQLPQYTPSSSVACSSTSESNTYAPSFSIHISGTGDDRAMARKVKRWIAEAWDEMLEKYESKTPQTQKV